MVMTGRERMLTALEHKRPDRPPFDLGGTVVTTINIAAYANLRHALGLPGEGRIIREQNQNAFVDEDVRQRLEVDVVGIYERAPIPALEQPDPAGRLVSEWGISYRQAEGFGAPYTMIAHPLSGASLDDLDRYPWPDPVAEPRFAGVAEEAAGLCNSQYAVAGSLGWSDTFSMAWFLRGFEAFMMDLVANKEFAHALMRRVTDYQVARYTRFLELCGEVLDVVAFCDDIGTQEGLFMSPRTYREMVKPYQAEIFAAIHAHTRARLMYHSCGSVMPLLDDFVDIGADILNPIQVSARGMDTVELKRRYGTRLAFWGAIDTHHVLPHGSPDDVRHEARRRIAELGAEGGYVVAPVHVVQRDVPPANVLALSEAVSTYRY